MKGFSVGLAAITLVAGCAGGGVQRATFATGAATQARLTEADRLLAETAPEIPVTAGGAAAADVCQVGPVTGSRIPRLHCELMTPSEAALVEMQTDEEIKLAREWQAHDEALEIDATLGVASASW